MTQTESQGDKCQSFNRDARLFFFDNSIITLHNVCSVHVQYIGGVGGGGGEEGGVQYIRGMEVFSTLGDSMTTLGVFSTLGDIMSTSGDVQYIGRYHDACGNTMSTSGDIMSTLGIS